MQMNIWLKQGTILRIRNEWILLLFAFKVYCDKFLVFYSYFHIVQKTISCFNLRTILYSRTKPIIYGFLGGYTQVAFLEYPNLTEQNIDLVRRIIFVQKQTKTSKM